jgi:putative dimethyl sulfoxide reductase chaperone
MSSVPSSGFNSSIAPDDVALSAVADLRSSAYRLFAALLDAPDSLALANVAEAATEFRAEERFALIFPFYAAWERLLDRLETLNDQDTDRAAATYRRLFYAHASEAPCPPNESFYIASSGDDAGTLLPQLRQRYTQAGLTLAPDVEQPDHVVVEFEFMAFLCAHEAQAWAGSVSDSGVRALKREAVFLRKHLADWFPRFARRIHRQDPGGLFAEIASVADAFVHHEQDLITLLLTHGEEQATAMGARPNAP